MGLGGGLFLQQDFSGLTAFGADGAVGAFSMRYDFDPLHVQIDPSDDFSTHCDRLTIPWEVSVPLNKNSHGGLSYAGTYTGRNLAPCFEPLALPLVI